MSAAIELILALDQRDETPNATPAICQAAARILIELGQAPLLCRLAQLNKTVHFALNVGANPLHAAVLARIGAQWPQQVPVALTLDAGLPVDQLLALHAFVQCPVRLDLHVKANGVVDEGLAQAFSQVIGHRALEALSLDISEHAVPVLSGLHGVKAQSISIVTSSAQILVDGPGPQTTAGASVESLALGPMFSEKGVGVYQKVLIDLVSLSGARVLKLPQSHRDVELSARLLAIRRDWHTVAFSMAESAPLLAWLNEGKKTIGQLELHRWPNTKHGSMAELLGCAGKSGVHTIAFHDTVRLGELVEGLHRHFMTSMHVFDRIEACFVLNELELEHHEAFTKYVAESLINNPMVTVVHHTPSAVVPHGGSSGVPGWPLDDGLVKVLDAVHVHAMRMGPAERLGSLKALFEIHTTNAIHAIGVHLSAGGNTARLIEDLRKLGPLFIHPKKTLAKVPAFEPTLTGALKALAWFDVDMKMIQAAVAQCLANDPAKAPELCRALMDSGLPMQPRDEKAWIRMGVPYAQTWLSEDEMQRYEEATKRGVEPTRYEGLTNEIFGLIAPPQHPDPNAMDSKVPDTDVDAVKPPDVAQAPAPVWVDVTGLVRPSSTATLNQLKAEFHLLGNGQLRRARIPLEVSAAIAIVQHLLDTGVFNPADVRNKAVGNQVVELLLEAGQGRLVQHIIEHTPLPHTWSVYVKSQKMALALSDVENWPKDVQCECALRIDPYLNLEVPEHVISFAARIASEQLTVVVTPGQNRAAAVLEAVINAHQEGGLQLTLNASGLPFDVDATVAFLKKVESVPMNALTVSGIASDDARLSTAVTGLIAGSGLKNIHVELCSTAMTRTLLRFQPWETVKVPSVLAAKLAFDREPASDARLVSAEHLVIRMQDAPDGDEQEFAETMVARCEGLKSVVFLEDAVNVLSLARGLDANGSVHTFSGALAWRDDGERLAAWKILQRNRSLRRFDMFNGLTQPGMQRAAARLVTRNRLRHPDLAAIGAGRGFGLRAKGLDMRDGGGHIGRLLNPKDALALALTNKAAYLASRRPWETEIERLASLFQTESPIEFRNKLRRQLNNLDLNNPTPASAATLAKAPAFTLLEKVDFMRSMHVPDFVIAEALRHALKKDPASSRGYLEAMVVVGAYPAQVWLKDIAGIDVQAVGATQG